MLAVPPEGVKSEELLMVDIGRPSFTNETQIEFWKKFHTWVQEGPVSMITSSVFWDMVAMLEKGQFYMGGGFKYCFWFLNEEDKVAFEDHITEMNKEWSIMMRDQRRREGR